MLIPSARIIWLGKSPAAFLLVLTRVRLDLAIDYHKINIGNFTPDRLKSTLYHELCHASHYTQVGAGGMEVQFARNCGRLRLILFQATV